METGGSPLSVNGWMLLPFVVMLAGCATTPPRNPEDLCAIFREKPDWYDAARDMQKQWGAPIQVPMAMMYQESSFRHDALPPRDYLLWVIPFGRVSDAYGYAQAKTDTWDDYRKATGNSGADRDDFADAIDFMGWYIAQSNKLNRVSKWDAKVQYLNYHEGWGGYRKRSYASKKWLLAVAAKVDERSRRYGAQLKGCEKELNSGWW